MVVRTSPVAVFDNLTSTPETTAPVESVTTPLSSPAPPCANAPTLRASTTNTRREYTQMFRKADFILFLLLNLVSLSRCWSVTIHCSGRVVLRHTAQWNYSKLMMAQL